MKSAHKEGNASQPIAFRPRLAGCISFFAAQRDAFCHKLKIRSLQAALGLETKLGCGNSSP
jgi:hypothetical protein